MLTHKGTKALRTSRLWLRRFCMEDCQAMFDNWASDPEVTKYLMWPAHDSPAVTQQILRQWVDAYEQIDWYQWAIVPQELGVPVGSISVISLNDALETAHVGYCIGRKWWGKGITAESLQAVMEFLFDQVGVQRIEARHDVKNPNSGKVMRKCGMRFEGTHRRSDRNNQGFCDVSWYALLAEDRMGR